MVESNQMVKKIFELMHFDMLSQKYIYDRMVVHKNHLLYLFWIMNYMRKQIKQTKNWDEINYLQLILKMYFYFLQHYNEYLFPVLDLLQ